MRARILAVVTALVAAWVPLAASPSPASAAPAFTSTVVNVGSGLCLDDPNSSTTNATQQIQYSCNSGTNQNWTFTPVSGTSAYAVANGASGQCLDISGRSTADNAQVSQSPCNSQTNQ